MKNSKIVIKILAIVISLIAGSCIDHYKVTTTVNADGSLTRTIQVVGDSASIFNGTLKVPTDSTLWEMSGQWITLDEKDTNDKKWEYTAKRTFKNVDELNEYLKVDNDTVQIIHSYTEFKKQFRWFYTYIEFKETYIQESPFNHVSLNEYMSESEYRYFWDDDFIYHPEHDSLIHISDLEEIPFLTKKDTIRGDELEVQILSKLADWYYRNVYEEYLTLVTQELIDTEPKKHERLNENRSTLFERIDPIALIESDSGYSEKPMKVIADFIEMTEEELMAMNPPVFEIFYKQLQISEEFFTDNYLIKQATELPGLLLESNADSVSTNTAFWNYNSARNFAQDYTLHAKCRIINNWAFVISSALVLALLIFILTGFKRKS